MTSIKGTMMLEAQIHAFKKSAILVLPQFRARFRKSLLLGLTEMVFKTDRKLP